MNRDRLITTSLLIVALALRVPFRSQLPFHWDSAQFAIAATDYDIRLSQPHAPGYYLYVMAGRLMNHFIGDTHASFVWISVLAGSALPAVLYWLGNLMFNRRVGIAAALLALTSPLLWFNSGVALTYVPDAFLGCSLMLLSWLAIQRGGWGYTLAISVVYVLIAGVRPQSAIPLLPLVAFTCWKMKRNRLQHFLAAAMIATVLTVAWAVPMTRSSGGLALFRQIVRLHAQEHANETVLGGGGWAAFQANVVRATLFAWTGLFVAAAAVPVALLHRVLQMEPDRRREWNRNFGSAFCMCVVWVLPMIGFGTIFALTLQPGYVLNYLPGLLLLTALALDHCRSRLAFVVCTGVLVAANGCIFTSWPLNWQPLLGSFWYTAAEIREHDNQLGSMIQLIRGRYNTSETVICHAQEYLLFGLRHFQYAVPEFDQYQMEIDRTIVSPRDRPMWRARHGKLEYVSGVDLAGKQTMLLVLPPGQSIEAFTTFWPPAQKARQVPGSKGTLYELTTAEAHGQ